MEFSQAEQNERAAKKLLDSYIEMVGDDLFERLYQEHKASLAAKQTEETPKKVTKAKKTEEEKPKKAKKTVKFTEEEEKKTKRIPRMSAPMLKQLQSAISKADAHVDMDNKKEMDKIKKNFVAYVDHLTEDDFTAKNLAEHMTDFVKLTFQNEEKKEEEKVDETIHELTLSELQSIEKLAEHKDFAPGVYWDGDSGRKVTGPDPDNDEEDVTVKFEKKRYIVGKTTGRIHNDDDDQDFVGYIGVLRFKDMRMPEEDE
jgi:hypothetical protein